MTEAKKKKTTSAQRRGRPPVRPRDPDRLTRALIRIQELERNMDNVVGLLTIFEKYLRGSLGRPNIDTLRAEQLLNSLAGLPPDSADFGPSESDGPSNYPEGSSASGADSV